MKRRLFFKLATAGMAMPPFSNLYKIFPLTEKNKIELTDEALRIHNSAIVIDGHNDLPSKIRLRGPDALDTFNLLTYQPEFQTDMFRLVKGGIGAQFWVADGSLGKPGDKRSASSYCLEEIELIRKMTQKCFPVLEMAYSYRDILRIHRKGKIASLIGIEGGKAIENSLGILGAYYSLGARYLTLTWADTIDWVDSATDKAKHGGLTKFGERVVLEMNRIGMLVDISHISHDAMRDVLRISKSPVIASHSSAYALAATPRNIPDDVLKTIKENDGIVMVNFYPGFLTQEGAKEDYLFWDYLRQLNNDPKLTENEINNLLIKWNKEHPVPGCSVERVVDHIEHIIKTAGIDNVGLGSDFDGISTTPENLEDVSYFPYITQILLNRGYKQDAIHKILGENFLRVFKTVEDKAGIK
jgi:membrane dipeptidase